LTAVGWSKKLVRSQSPLLPYFYDTYANLLYKLDQKDSNAIEAEKKAIELFPEKEKAAAEQTLAKMKSGQKTWTN
jgi:hypothetical protein